MPLRTTIGWANLRSRHIILCRGTETRLRNPRNGFLIPGCNSRSKERGGALLSPPDLFFATGTKKHKKDNKQDKSMTRIPMNSPLFKLACLPQSIRKREGKLVALDRKSTRLNSSHRCS